MKTAAPSQSVELTQEGRLYGMPSQNVLERARQELPPEIGKIFVEDLTTSSAILALSGHSTRDQIITAYGADITSLARRRQEADGFMLEVLVCAMDRFNLDDPKKRKAEIDMLKKLLEPLGITPQISFTAERSAMKPADLVDWLKPEFLSEIDKIARRIATTLQYLADFNVVGLVDWKTSDVCKFHYFTWSAEHSSATKTELSGSIMTWNTLTSTTTEIARLSRTRHTHHVVNAGIHIAKDYKRQMPQCIKELINKAPTWLKRHLVIIDGTETLSEQITTLADQSVSETVKSVVRYDPAVAIGNFALAGWNDSDLQVIPVAKEEYNWKKIFQVTVFCFGVLVIIIWTTNYYYKKWETEGYNYYVKRLTGEKYRTADGELFKLPIDYRLTYHAPNQSLSRWIRLSTKTAANGEWIPAEKWINVELPYSKDGWKYGDLDLRKELGIPIILHVSYAGEDGIHYTVEKRSSVD